MWLGSVWLRRPMPPFSTLDASTYCGINQRSNWGDYMQRKLIVATATLLLLVACGVEETIAIRGDSTAIASRSGIAKVFNLMPSWDWKRWWVVVSSDLGRKPFNDGVGGQDIRTMRAKMEADQSHRKVTTVIYDRRNDGEDAVSYVSELSAAVATLQTDQFLIMPQVPKSSGFRETEDQTAAMAEIDRRVLEMWPSNTLSLAERKAFLAELETDETRLDGLHRNETGQAIEARYIGGWLKQRGW